MEGRDRGQELEGSGGLRVSVGLPVNVLLKLIFLSLLPPSLLPLLLPPFCLLPLLLSLSQHSPVQWKQRDLLPLRQLQHQVPAGAVRECLVRGKVGGEGAIIVLCYGLYSRSTVMLNCVSVMLVYQVGFIHVCHTVKNCWRIGLWSVNDQSTMQISSSLSPLRPSASGLCLFISS